MERPGMGRFLYGEYVKGKYKLGRNEIYQVGFRIAGQMKLPKLYAVDSWPFSAEFEKQYPWIDKLWEEGKPVDSLRDKYWDKNTARCTAPAIH